MRGLVLGLLVLFGGVAIAQKPFTRDFAVTESNTGVKVNALAQDATGYIWIATDAGLIRYNGRTFLKIEDSIHKPVTAVTAVGNYIYAGYKNGSIGVVENLAIKPVKIYNGPTSSITSLTANGPGILTATTEEQGVYFIVNNIAFAVNTANGLSDNFTYGASPVNKNRMLAGSDIGVNDISIEGNKLAVNTCTSKQGLPDNIVCVVKSIPGTSQYWIGTQEGGVVMYDGMSKKITPALQGNTQWTYGQVNDILPVSGKRAWVATESGYLLELSMNDSNQLRLIPYFYPGKNFRKLLLDKAGNVWCGTTRGLTLMTGEYVMNLKLGSPYSLRETTAMIWANNALLIGLKNKLYKVVQKDSATQLQPIFNARATITSLFIDNDKRLWVGTLGDGLYYQKDKAFIKVRGVDEIGDDASILSITGTATGIWVAGLKGVDELSCPDVGKITLLKHHGKKTGIGSDYVYQLYPDSKGNIWMATDGAGVCMYDGAKYHHWNSAFGPGGKVAYSITEDTAGDIWAATMDRDLYHFHKNKWENLRLPETQYPDVNVSAVMANATGQVVSVYRRCIDEWYPGSRYFRHFNSALGIGIDSTSNVVNCIAKDREGNIYSPYERGILVFKNQDKVFDIRPGVHITNPSVYLKPIATEKHKFDYDENYLGFSFDGVSFANHERLNFRYRLQGYNDDWIYTNDASVSFPKLPPGSYNFRVQASLNPAFEHPNEDSYSFSIATPFWKTNLFYGSSTLLVILLGLSYIKMREKRLKSISRLQQERMMFEYEHLKSQVNPHFLFNSLYALSILIEEKKENALSYTVNLADLYRNMLTYSKNDLILLKEEFEILNNYISIQQTRFGESLRIKTDVSQEVMETKKIVPLALQLLVENAIKHNVVSLAQPLVINISATKDEIKIWNVIQPKLSREKGAGVGLINIKQRYGLLTKRPVSYGAVENQFIVKLPLL